jgi:hypothetical protein
VLLEILKVLLGVAAGAFLNEWLRRRSARVQTIPLIQRVNRLVNPDLQEFTLARKLDDGRLEEVKNVREYQFTLRNTSAVHLQDVEVQFEFPADDVEGHAERPTLSKTPPISVDAIVTPPWKRSFRWRIPRFPSSDTIDFTFRAVEPESDKFEVAMFRSDRVVIERSERDSSTRSVGRFSFEDGYRIFAAMASLGIVVGLLVMPVGSSNKTLNMVDEGGCSLTVISSYRHFNVGSWPWQGPWQIDYEVDNRQNRDCKLHSDLFADGVSTVYASSELLRTIYSADKPRKERISLFTGPDAPTHESKIKYMPRLRDNRGLTYAAFKTDRVVCGVGVSQSARRLIASRRGLLGCGRGIRFG